MSPTLGGKTVAVLDGTADEAVLRDALDAANVKAAITTMGAFAQVEDAVVTGTTDAGTMSYPTAIIVQSRSPVPLAIVPIDLLRNPIAIVTPRGDVTFQQAVNEALQTVIDDGTWLALFEEWIGSPPPFTVEEMSAVPAS
ncbi:MAG: hypothetical protein BMS9Abin20_1360 [Acidimicrobiia bacterium]|nr:MAG: hypothetical protein BMS9Abin20_1360 [Acidimicrobiia bacterium]